MQKYDVIVIDPPWQIKKLKRLARPTQINMDYPLMSIDDIKALSIASIASDNSWCFLWTTQKYLYESKDILESWGFKFMMTMVWQKTYGKSAGMPLYGFMWNAEFILVGYKTKKDLWPKRPLIPAVFQAENWRHSEKPQKFYDYVSVLGHKRIDMFARKKRDGWDIWGNEVENDIDFNA